MAVKILEIPVKVSPQELASGWRQNPATGAWYYYDEAGRRYVYNAGYIYPAMAWQPAPKVVKVALGDTLRISFSFQYSGPAKTVKPYGAIGGKIWPDIFDEYIPVTGAAFGLSQSTTPLTYNRTIDIPVGSPLVAGRNYGIYVKVIDGVSFKEGETGSFALENAIFVVSAEPTFSNFSITDYLKA